MNLNYISFLTNNQNEISSDNETKYINKNIYKFECKNFYKIIFAIHCENKRLQLIILKIIL